MTRSRHLAVRAAFPVLVATFITSVAGADTKHRAIAIGDLDWVSSPAAGTFGVSPDERDRRSSEPAGIAGAGPFPLDSGVLPGPWSLPGSFYPDFGYWTYSDENGRVRTHVKTGQDALQSSAALATVVWRGSYQRDTGNDPTFTLNPSWLELRADQRGEGALLRVRPARRSVNHLLAKSAGEAEGDYFPLPHPPFAKMAMRVSVHTVGRTETVFSHESLLLGIAYDADEPIRQEFAITRGAYDANYDWEIPKTAHPVQDGEKLIFISDPHCFQLYQIGPDVCAGEIIRGMRYDIGPYTGRIDLDALGVRPGEHYTIRYSLDVEAGEDRQESFAEAYLADPLDNGIGGFALTTDHTAVEMPSQDCDRLPDAARYRIHADGTATDTQTGLMWQRCPAGATLDDNGTADPDDDTCGAAAPPLFDWQSTLLNAQGDLLAGYADWRVPDVKALESLVLPGCTNVAADRLAFPDTPTARFWSSTPIREDAVAWQVDFLDGDVSFEDTAVPAYVRLVRDEALGPQLPRPRISVGPARVPESGSGETAVLSFSVTVSRPHDEDIILDYATEPLNASETTDYVPVSGSLTIPAGQRQASIDVTVTGDDEPEGDETLWLAVSNAASNAQLSASGAIGTIEDDEPAIATTSTGLEFREGDSGSTVYSIPLTLDRPATAAINVDYSVEGGNAQAGVDFTAVSGTATFNVGDIETVVEVPVHGDTSVENDETFAVLLSNPVGVHLPIGRLVGFIVNDDGNATFAALNDTGAIHCANATGGGLGCPQAGFPNQDGETGRDLSDADPDDGDRGFSFTKHDAAGADLARADLAWSCVRDEVTGLTWETKTRNDTDLQYYEWTYSWLNSTGIDDGGDEGLADGGTCLDAGQCDTEKYVAAINALALCGFSDWRLPAVDELLTIGFMSWQSSVVSNGVDAVYFPNSGTTLDGPVYWTSNSYAGDPSLAWIVRLNTFEATARYGAKSGAVNLRLVRGGTQLQ
jgi:hypothetical protein